MTGGDFKLILGSEGAIIGVVSASKDAPFKKVDFDKELENSVTPKVTPTGNSRQSLGAVQRLKG
jgi:hypothetical protein